VFQTLTKNWWLLALCGVLDAMLFVIYFVMQDQDGPVTFHALKGTIALLGKLTLAAGVCTIAAARGKCWPLVLNGLALIALGVIYTYLTGFRISLRTISLLIIVMAMSLAILEWRLRHALAGVASVGFALVFSALGFHWIKLELGSHLDLLWLGAYFGFSAICMLVLAFRLQNRMCY
jgi:uncharacterized membrane protein